MSEEEKAEMLKTIVCIWCRSPDIRICNAGRHRVAMNGVGRGG